MHNHSCRSGADIIPEYLYNKFKHNNDLTIFTFTLNTLWILENRIDREDVNMPHAMQYLFEIRWLNVQANKYSIDRIIAVPSLQ